MVNFRQNLYFEEHSFSRPGKTTGARSSGAAQPKEIGELELRLANVLVHDNNTPAQFPFPGYAKLYFLCIIVTNGFGENYRLHLKTFDGVDDGDALNMDKTIFHWKKQNTADAALSQIHVFTAVVKSKQPLRDVASVLSELYRDPSYKLLTATLNNLTKGATTLPDISNLMINIAGIAGKYLGKTDDRPLLGWYQGFIDIKTEWDVLGKTEKMAANRYAGITLSLVVRDGMPAEETIKDEGTNKTGVPLLFPFKT